MSPRLEHPRQLSQRQSGVCDVFQCLCASHEIKGIGGERDPAAVPLDQLHLLPEFVEKPLRRSQIGAHEFDARDEAAAASDPEHKPAHAAADIEHARSRPHP